jgi:hypothetical protein
MYSYYIEEMVKALAQTPDIITLADDDKFKIDEELARKVLEAYWSNYAVSVFEFRQVVEAAERNAIPVTPVDVREILHNVEEGVVSVDHDALDEGVTDFGARFDWCDPETPIDYAAYTLKTCDWLIVLDRDGKDPEHELPGWTKLQNGKVVRVVDCQETLAQAILTTKAHDDAERDIYSDQKRSYVIHAVEYFIPKEEDALEKLEKLEHSDADVFHSEYDFYRGFGTKPETTEAE